jgi:hypothetical protein
MFTWSILFSELQLWRQSRMPWPLSTREELKLPNSRSSSSDAMTVTFVKGKSQSVLCAYLSTTPWRRIHCLIMHHTMKMYGVSGDIAPRILNIGITGEWSASLLGCFMPGERNLAPAGQEAERTPLSVWTGWRGENYPSSCRESNPGRSVRSLVTILTELSLLPTSYKNYVWCGGY